MKSRTVVRLAGIVIGLALVTTGSLSATPMLYGITNAGTLFTVDPTTLFINTLGTVPGGVAVIGVATNGANLYTFDRNTDRVLQIDPNNANVLNTIDVGLGSAVIGEGDLTFGSPTQGLISFSGWPGCRCRHTLRTSARGRGLLYRQHDDRSSHPRWLYGDSGRTIQFWRTCLQLTQQHDVRRLGKQHPFKPVYNRSHDRSSHSDRPNWRHHERGRPRGIRCQPGDYA